MGRLPEGRRGLRPLLRRDTQRALRRRHGGELGAGAPRQRTSAANWRKPLRWNRDGTFYAIHRRRQRVFCASLSDWLDNSVPLEWRVDLLDLVRQTPNLDWLLLTKRIGNWMKLLQEASDYAFNHRRDDLYAWIEGWLEGNAPANVWLGATIVNQEEADRDIPKLLAVPARVRFLSMEPLLGPADISRHLDYCEKLDKHGISRRAGGQHIKCDEHCGISWVIVGGESGRGARPMHSDWARSLRDQCAEAGVPFLFKQHGEWAPGSGDFGAGRVETAAIALDGRVATGGYRVEDYPRGAASSDGWSMVHRAGKRAAGRHLDGRTHDEFPEAQ
ncbi:phage Gp37/Gp68 family protein [Burkholderia cepacia]|uniref:phage Gp37/Gp68 family protein n=1 Tax=Burkholderia cepacia TaxID=292 RepID=UPI00389A561A